MGDVIDIYGLSPCKRNTVSYFIHQDDEHSFSYIVQVGFLLGGNWMLILLKRLGNMLLIDMRFYVQYLMGGSRKATTSGLPTSSFYYSSRGLEHLST